MELLGKRGGCSADALDLFLPCRDIKERFPVAAAQSQKVPREAGPFNALKCCWALGLRWGEIVRPGQLG